MTTLPPSMGAPLLPEEEGGVGERRLLRHRLAVLSIMAPIAAVGTMSYPLIALVMERAGVSEFWIGFNAACAAVAIIVSSFLGPRLLGVLRLEQYMAAGIVLTLLPLVLFPFTSDYALWTLLRIALGASGGAIFLAAEYWIVTVAPPEKRGREVAWYALAIAGGMAIGPLFLGVTGAEGAVPFMACAGLAALSAAALALGWRLAPAVRGERRRGGVLGFFFSDPSLLWAVALFGAVEFGAFGLLPVWILREGLTEAQSIAGVAAVALGGLVFQPLIGLAIDRAPPRPLLIGATLACIVTPSAAAVATGDVALLYLALFLWGGLAGALYTVSLSTLGGRYSGSDLAAANAAVVAGYGLGALVGPLAIGAAMSALGPEGLPIVAASLAAAYLALALWRARARRG